jgi:hypothetical protein
METSISSCDNKVGIKYVYAMAFGETDREQKRGLTGVGRYVMETKTTEYLVSMWVPHKA